MFLAVVFLLFSHVLEKFNMEIVARAGAPKGFTATGNCKQSHAALRYKGNAVVDCATGLMRGNAGSNIFYYVGTVAEFAKYFGEQALRVSIPNVAVEIISFVLREVMFLELLLWRVVFVLFTTFRVDRVAILDIPEK